MSGEYIEARNGYRFYKIKDRGDYLPFSYLNNISMTTMSLRKIRSYLDGNSTIIDGVEYTKKSSVLGAFRLMIECVLGDLDNMKRENDSLFSEEDDESVGLDGVLSDFEYNSTIDQVSNLLRQKYLNPITSNDFKPGERQEVQRPRYEPKSSEDGSTVS